MPGTQRQGDKAADAAEQKVADKTTAEKNAPAGTAGKSDRPDVEFGVPNDASGTAMAAADPEVVVTDGASPRYSTKPDDVTADPRTGKPFGAGDAFAGLKGTHGEDLMDGNKVVVPGVNPDAVPAEVTPGVSPDAGGDQLLAAAQAKAPSLTREFVEKMGLSEQNLVEIAQGLVPPPPTPGPIHTADMYRTPGGYQQTPPGVPPEDVGKNQAHRA